MNTILFSSNLIISRSFLFLFGVHEKSINMEVLIVVVYSPWTDFCHSPLALYLFGGGENSDPDDTDFGCIP